ncbi:MAG: PHP domain-containing protein [Clostridia bacterium]|nr:PHP domain-containing protein [Clostridia bacterium]
MQKFKTEMHCHTAETSNCGKADASELIDAYLRHEYDTVIITDHMSTHTFFKYNYKKLSWDEIVDIFLQGYNAAKEYADGRINVLLGMELRFDSPSENDYLVYGITEQFLRRNKNLLDMDIKSFSKLAKKNDLLIFQAHPFRFNMTVTNPEYLTGIEVFNGCVRHNSNNDIAEIWANKYKFHTTSGSDFHQLGDEARGGIITDISITSNDELLRVLKKRDYSLIRV